MKIIIEDESENKIEVENVSTIELNRMAKRGHALHYIGNVMDFTEGSNSVYMKFIDNVNNIYVTEIR